MVNKHRGERKIELEEESYKVKYTLTDVAELEDDIGADSAEELSKKLMDPGIKTMLKLIYWGIHRDAPEDWSWRDVGDRLEHFTEASEIAAEAVNEQLAVDVDEEDLPDEMRDRLRKQKAEQSEKEEQDQEENKKK